MQALVLAGMVIGATAGSGPWFVRASCVEAVEQVYVGDLAGARQRAATLTESADLDDQACGRWLAVSMAEMEVALEGDGEAVYRRQAQRLDALAAFGRAHAPKSARFADLILEAQLRRVRLLIARGERTAAVSAARDAQRSLERRRGKGSVTPTLMYATAVQNLALARAEWPVKAVLRLAGLKADEDRGARALKVLLERPSVYRIEAQYLARTFANRGAAEGQKLSYSAPLHARFPDNPQLAYDYALDLMHTGSPERAQQTLAPALARIDADPTLWCARLRTRVFWILGRAALARKDSPRARTLALRARQDATDDMKPRVDALWDAVGE